MGIKSLEIKGFRSLREVRWEPGRLNVLIGPNGSGKSNLLDACALLQEATQGKLAEGIARRGGITPLLWDQREGSSWKLASDHIDFGVFTYDLELRHFRATGLFGVNREELENEEVLLLSRDARGAKAYSHGDSVVWAEEFAEDQTLLPEISRRDNIRAYIFKRDIETWSIYESLRVDRESDVRQASVTRLEKRIALNGQNLTPVLHTLYTSDRDFRRTLDAAMRAAFGDDYEELIFPPAADQRVQLRLRWRSLKTEQSAANLSDGTLRFLVLVAILASPVPGFLVAIDEPEMGLHPRMLPIIAELAQEASERTQVVFTTHSPQFLDAFTGEPPTTTVAEWADGETRLTNVDGEELRRWLSKYSLGSLFRSGELEALA